MASRKAVEASPADSPHRPLILYALASALHEHTGSVEEAITLCRQAVELGRVVDPEHALLAAHSWAWWAFRRGAFREASDAYAHAIAIVDALYEEQPLRSGKQAWLREAQTIYAEAAYCRARLGDLPGAVLALETGRARMLTDALDRNRADLEQAEKQSPEVVASYREALARLDRIEIEESIGARLQTSGDRPPQADEIRKARAAVRSAVKAIRTLPGHEAFLTPPSAETISAALVPGEPVVYLAATPAGGMALVVSATAARMQVIPMWLDGLTQAAVLEILQSARYGESAPTSWFGACDRWLARPTDRKARARWYEAIVRTTRTLWDLAMGPVIALLREHHAGSEQVALIPHGLLALLPLHAAWTDEDTARPHFALDEVAVFYAPSLRALKHAREVSDRCDSRTVMDDPSAEQSTMSTERTDTGLPAPRSRAPVSCGRASSNSARTAALWRRDTLALPPTSGGILEQLAIAAADASWKAAASATRDRAGLVRRRRGGCVVKFVASRYTKRGTRASTRAG